VDKELINYADYIHVYNSITRTYDLIHKATGFLLKQNISALTKRSHTEFDPLTADIIFNKLSEGQRLSDICGKDGIPSLAVVSLWKRNNKVFSESIKLALEIASEIYYGKIMGIAEEARSVHKDAVPGLRLSVDTYKWAAEKANPERFAKPKEESNNVGSITINLQTGVLDRAAPMDIVVDQFGNFQGFGGSELIADSNVVADEKIVELNTNRWGEYNEGYEESEGTNS
jgi:hypothetical protein